MLPVIRAVSITFPPLIAFFQQVFLCTEFNTVLLFYEHSTIEIADQLLGCLIGDGRSDAARHAFVMRNIDLPELTHNNARSGHRNANGVYISERLKPAFAHCVSIELLRDHNASSAWQYRQAVLNLKIKSKWIRVNLLPQNQSFLNLYNYIVIVELPSVNDGGAARLEVSRYNYQLRERVDLFAEAATNRSLYATLFQEQRIDMCGAPLNMLAHMDAPNMYLAERRHRRQHDDERDRHGVAGFYQSVCALIGKYFNATVQFVAYEDWRHHNSDPSLEPYIEYGRLRRRIYAADIVLPCVWLPTERAMTPWLRDEYTKISGALYPHRQENYVLLVPNERPHGGRELWKVLAGSPLMGVWTTAIVMFTLMRVVIRALLRDVDGPQSSRHSRHGCLARIDPLTLDICGMSFGVSIAIRTQSRAERVLQMFVSAFAIVSGVYCSGLLVQKFAFGNAAPLMNTLADLYAVPNTTILMPWGLDVNWSLFNPNQLSGVLGWLVVWGGKSIDFVVFTYSTLVFRRHSMVFGEILRKNITCAYILPESDADVLLAEEHMFDADTQSPIFRKLQERICMYLVS